MEKKIKFVIEQVKCFKCGKVINKKIENYIELSTYNKNNLIEQIIFHPNCWGEYNNDRMNQRLKELTNMGLGILKNTGMIS